MRNSEQVALTGQGQGEAQSALKCDVLIFNVQDEMAFVNHLAGQLLPFLDQEREMLAGKTQPGANTFGYLLARARTEWLESNVPRHLLPSVLDAEMAARKEVAA